MRITNNINKKNIYLLIKLQIGNLLNFNNCFFITLLIEEFQYLYDRRVFMLTILFSHSVNYLTTVKELVIIKFEILMQYVITLTMIVLIGCKTHHDSIT